jgi:hypothetical protein
VSDLDSGGSLIGLGGRPRVPCPTLGGRDA